MAFASTAYNLVEGDTNDTSDIFVHDRQTGETTRVSVSSGGQQGNGRSWAPRISDDGDVIVFTSLAWNLVFGDTNRERDVFVHQRSTGLTTRVNVSSDGLETDDWSDADCVTGDGRLVSFTSKATHLVPGDSNDKWDVFLHDRFTGRTERVSLGVGGAQPNGTSACSSLSAGARKVAFCSNATNLVPGDTNELGDTFVRDLETGEVFRANVSSAGEQALGGGSGRMMISGNGAWAVFTSYATNLVPGDTNGRGDVFTRDLVNGITKRISVAPDGAQSNADSFACYISWPGSHVLFVSFADNLVPGDKNEVSDLFQHARIPGLTVLASVSSLGAQGNKGSDPWASMSASGHVVAFSDHSTNLVDGDHNATSDVFVRDCPPPRPPVAYCSAKDNSQGCTPAISSTGFPSKLAGSGFVIRASEILNNKLGLLLYSRNGPDFTPFQGGYLCISPPIERTPAQTSGGTPPPQVDCSGRFEFDFNAWMRAQPRERFLPGLLVVAQYWSRDPGFPPPANSNLTDALDFFVYP